MGLPEMDSAPEQREGIDLDELQREAEKLLGLLRDRQPGLSTWNGFMKEKLEALHRLTSRALGKEENE